MYTNTLIPQLTDLFTKSFDLIFKLRVHILLDLLCFNILPYSSALKIKKALTYYQLVDRSIFYSNFSSMPLQIVFGHEPIRHTSKG